MSCPNCGEGLKCVVGWRAWFDNGDVWNSREHKWAERDDVLIRMVYYCDDTKQVQMGMEYYFEAPHSSGEAVIATGNDQEDIKRRYPDSIIARGRWAPDGLWYRVKAEAMESVWNAG